jgi:hypothetical protein
MNPERGYPVKHAAISEAALATASSSASAKE